MIKPAHGRCRQAVHCAQVAGAVAASGAPLKAVAAAAQRAAATVATVGASLSSCTLPGRPPVDALPAGMVEVGLGIHGEPGASSRQFRDAGDLTALLMELLLDTAHGRACGAGDRAAVIVNDLGSVTPMELHVVSRHVLTQLQGKLPHFLHCRPARLAVRGGVVCRSALSRHRDGDLDSGTPAIAASLLRAVHCIAIYSGGNVAAAAHAQKRE